MPRITCQALAAGLFLLALASLAAVASAAMPPERPLPPERPDVIIRPPWPGPRVGLDVLVDGQPLPVIAHGGRLYLPVRRLGAEYELRVWNHGLRRVAAVVSVDGLSVLHGRPAAESDPGYIVEPNGSVLIKGWRRDRSTVAAFSFQPRENSYAARVGRPENVGVLGLVAIEEQGRDIYPPLPTDKRDRARPTPFPLPAPGRAAEVGGTGTGHGRDIDSAITEVPFVRGPRRQHITYYYDTVENLRRAGVPVDGPRPFPRDGDWVPPPPPRGLGK